MEEILQAILEELRSQNRPPLGFGPTPRPRYIYANRQYSDCLWYFWNKEQNTHEPIPHPALTGYIEKLEIEAKEYKGKAEPKLSIHLRGDRRYVIQAGVDTQFARGILYPFSRLTVTAFRKPIMIAVEAGEDERVLFSRIYNPATGEQVFAPYPDDADWAAIAAKAIEKIEQAQEVAP